MSSNIGIKDAGHISENCCTFLDVYTFINIKVVVCGKYINLNKITKT